MAKDTAELSEAEMRQQMADAEELVKKLRTIPVGLLYEAARERTIGFLSGVWVGDELRRR